MEVLINSHDAGAAQCKFYKYLLKLEPFFYKEYIPNKKVAEQILKVLKDTKLTLHDQGATLNFIYL